MEKTRATLGRMRTLLVSLSAAVVVGCAGTPDATHTPATKMDAPAKPVSAPATLDASRYFGNARGCFTMRELGSGESFEMGGEECAERSLPASTFKIPNAIIALDSGVLKDETVVKKWDGIKRWHEDWNRDHALPTSMWYSVVWFYQGFAGDVGADRYRKYLTSFQYGNADPSGDITMFWLNGPLRISPQEQITFLTNLYEGKLPVSKRAVDIVKKILEVRGEAKMHLRKRLPFVDQIPENVVLSGKTGSILWDDRPLGPTDVVGWYVGSVEREGHRWVFACRIRSNDEKKIGVEAARIAYEILHDRGML